MTDAPARTESSGNGYGGERPGERAGVERPPGRCPLCGGPTFGWVEARPMDPEREGSCLVDRCEECGLGITVEPAAAGAALYESGAYSPGRPHLARLAGPVLAMFDRARLRLLRGSVPARGRVLEVGAGRGRFLARLAAAGYEASGLEPSEHRLREARALGLDVEGSAVEEASIEPRSQDAVVAWHVLEHLADPGGALDRIHGWLRPGGTLVLGLPNRAGLQASLGHDQWFHLDVPRHRFHFTPRALHLLLDRHGFEVVRMRHLMLEHNPFGMWQTLMNALTFHPQFLFLLLKRALAPRTARSRLRFWIDALVTALVGIPAAIVAVPLEAAAGLARRGGTIAVVARKR